MLSFVMETFWLRFERFCSSLVGPGDDLLVAMGDLLDDGRYDNRGISGGEDGSTGSGSRFEVFLEIVSVDSVSENHNYIK